jgi:hypothetical protein
VKAAPAKSPVMREPSPMGALLMAEQPARRPKLAHPRPHCQARHRYFSSAGDKGGAAALQGAMKKSATDVMQDIVSAAVIDGIAALKTASKGLPNNLLRDLNAIHANTAQADLPPDLQASIAASVRSAFSKLLKEGYSVAPGTGQPPRPHSAGPGGTGPRGPGGGGERRPQSRSGPRREGGGPGRPGGAPRGPGSGGPGGTGGPGGPGGGDRPKRPPRPR